METSAAVRIDTPLAQPAGRKTYVLDTNVLLHDPTALLRCGAPRGHSHDGA